MLLPPRRPAAPPPAGHPRGDPNMQGDASRKVARVSGAFKQVTCRSPLKYNGTVPARRTASAPATQCTYRCQRHIPVRAVGTLEALRGVWCVGMAAVTGVPAAAGPGRASPRRCRVAISSSGIPRLPRLGRASPWQRPSAAVSAQMRVTPASSSPAVHAPGAARARSGAAPARGGISASGGSRRNGVLVWTKPNNRVIRGVPTSRAVPEPADGTAEASPSAPPAAASSGSGIAPTSLRVHYYRRDGRYAGWGCHPWGDTPVSVSWETPLQPTSFDGFGAVYDLPLHPGASTVDLIIHKREDKDQELAIDIARVASGR